MTRREEIVNNIGYKITKAAIEYYQANCANDVDLLKHLRRVQNGCKRRLLTRLLNGSLRMSMTTSIPKTKKELNHLEKQWRNSMKMYIARDFGGGLYLFPEKPIKLVEYNCWDAELLCCRISWRQVKLDTEVLTP